MSQVFQFLFLLFFSVVSAQSNLELENVKDFLADDYGNIYAYQNRDFSFVKYDSLGKQIGKMMLVSPYKIQSVQNPLNIVLFSENAQEIKFIDQNLNEIQTLDLKEKFGFVRMAFAEDLQKVWLLDESKNQLIYYNFREDRLMNSFPMRFNLNNVIDILVFESKLYLLRENSLEIYNFNSEKLAEFKTNNAKRLSREGDDIFVISRQEIFKFSFSSGFKSVFSNKEAKIVDKNHLQFLALIGDKFYLYKIK